MDSLIIGYEVPAMSIIFSHVVKLKLGIHIFSIILSRFRILLCYWQRQTTITNQISGALHCVFSCLLHLTHHQVAAVVDGWMQLSARPKRPRPRLES